MIRNRTEINFEFAARRSCKWIQLPGRRRIISFRGIVQQTRSPRRLQEILYLSGRYAQRIRLPNRYRFQNRRC